MSLFLIKIVQVHTCLWFYYYDMMFVFCWIMKTKRSLRVRDVLFIKVSFLFKGFCCFVSFSLFVLLLLQLLPHWTLVLFV